MSLNIKNEEAHALATRIARATGESLTEAVTIPLRERWARLESPDALADELLKRDEIKFDSLNWRSSLRILAG